MYQPTLKSRYTETIIPAMKEKFGYKNDMMVPKLEKICLNQGLGAAVADKKIVDAAVEEMTMIVDSALLKLNHVKISQTSNYVKVCQLAPAYRCVKTICLSSYNA